MVTVNPHIGYDESGFEPVNPDWLDLCNDPDALEAELREPAIDSWHPALMHTVSPDHGRTWTPKGDGWITGPAAQFGV